jgi:cytochrome b561
MNIHRYSNVAIALHWLMALAIVAGFAMGLYMVDLAFSPNKLKLYSWHKWIGVSVFALAAIRLLWRLTHAAPPLPQGAPVWQQWAAHGTHMALYVLFFALPLSGWLFSSAAGFQTVYLGLIPLPDLIEKNRELADTLKAVHRYLGYALAALVTVHVAAALKHQFIDRDGLMRRILPGGRS